jgi:hypothetical protein
MKTVSVMLALCCLVSVAQAAEPSCEKELGAEGAQELVQQCLLVSPAPHLLCKSASPCEIMTGEISKGCLKDQADREKNHKEIDKKIDFCEQYLQDNIE